MEPLSNELIHHGIEGQKWGVQNGPPYPLSRQKDSSRKDDAKKKIKEIADKARESHRRRKAAAKVKAAERKEKHVEKKTAREEKKEQIRREKFEKERHYKMRDPKWLRKHMGDLTNDELKNARERLNLENNLRDENVRKLNTGKVYTDMVLGYLDSGIRAYNTVAKIYNVNADKDDRLPLIGENSKDDKKKGGDSGGKKNKKNKNNDNNNNNNNSKSTDSRTYNIGFVIRGSKTENSQSNKNNSNKERDKRK